MHPEEIVKKYMTEYKQSREHALLNVRKWHPEYFDADGNPNWENQSPDARLSEQ